MGPADPCMARQPPEARNYFLACYAVSLVQGHTTKEAYIKHSTLKDYMKEALKAFSDRVISHFSEPDCQATVTK